MATTLKKLTENFDLSLSGNVKWSQLINSNKCGLYFITIANDPTNLACWEQPEFNDNIINDWIKLIKQYGKQITVDRRSAHLQILKDRFSKLWLKDETILYIGKAGPNKSRTIQKRVDEYYNTKLGCNKWHAGGNWINVLSKLDQLNVFYSEFKESDYNKIEDTEEKLIKYFSSNVSDSAKETLIDRNNCFPFANKIIYIRSEKKKIKKNHGINNQTVNCGNNWKK